RPSPSTLRSPPRAGSPAPPTREERRPPRRRSIRSRRAAAAAPRAGATRRGARTPSAGHPPADPPARRRRERPRRSPSCGGLLGGRLLRGGRRRLPGGGGRLLRGRGFLLRSRLRLCALGQRLLEPLESLVLAHVLRIHELGGEDLLRLDVHLLLTGREALLAVAEREVAHDLGELVDVAGLDLEVLALLAENFLLLALHDRACTVVRIHHLVADLVQVLLRFPSVVAKVP